MGKLTHDTVSFAAVFWDVTQRFRGALRDIPNTAAKETTVIPQSNKNTMSTLI